VKDRFVAENERTKMMLSKAIGCAAFLN